MVEVTCLTNLRYFYAALLEEKNIGKNVRLRGIVLVDFNTGQSAEIMRFEFGKNWRRYAGLIDEQRIRVAEESLQSMLEVTNLRGMHFLDVGSGSGIFSLAARRLGASVLSFDFDSEAVACTESLRDQYFPDDRNWRIQRGDILDQGFIESLDAYDVVYSWGVLHHTGAMRAALENSASVVREGGYLFVAIYNDQGLLSYYWRTVKKIYNSNPLGGLLMTLVHAPYLFLLRRLVRAVLHRGDLPRGMDIWRDMVDWLGGFPFEVAKPEEIFKIFKHRGFRLQNIKTCGGRHGCNEFVFRRDRL